MISSDDALAKRLLHQVRAQAWDKGLSRIPVRALSSKRLVNDEQVNSVAPWDLALRRRQENSDDDKPGLAWDVSKKYRYSTITSLHHTSKKLTSERGWTAHLAAAHLLNSWSTIVGPTVAEHCVVVSSISQILDEQTLMLKASSSSWAQQIRLITPSIQRQIDDLVGVGVIKKLIVHGPSQRSWTHGKRSLRGGRGPRDTYG